MEKWLEKSPQLPIDHHDASFTTPPSDSKDMSLSKSERFQNAWRRTPVYFIISRMVSLEIVKQSSERWWEIVKITDRFNIGKR